MGTINTRRWTHAALVVVVAAAFTTRGFARDPVAVDLEAGGYGGTNSGRLPPVGACISSPQVGIAYGGFGGRARVRFTEPGGSRDHGWAFDAQGAVERNSNSLLTTGDGTARAAPPDQNMGGGALTFGYDGRLFGLRLGLGAHEAYGHAGPTCFSSDPGCVTAGSYPSQLLWFPALALRAGPAVGLHFEHVVGSYSIATTLRPGVHVGLGYTWARGYEVMFRAGVQTAVSGDFLGDSRGRLDLSGAVPITDHLLFGLGAGLVPGEVRNNFDGRASLTVRLGP